MCAQDAETGARSSISSSTRRGMGLVQVIQAYRPPIALICLEAVCLIVYEKPPADHQGIHQTSSTPAEGGCFRGCATAQAVGTSRLSIEGSPRGPLTGVLLQCTPRVTVVALQTGVCRLRQLLYKMTMMEYNQVRPCVITKCVS